MYVEDRRWKEMVERWGREGRVRGEDRKKCIVPVSLK
jgi:hypothetical protein